MSSVEPNEVTPARTSGKAIAALIFGVVGIVLVPLVASIPAVIYGHLARREVKGTPERWKGQGLATTGLILGWIGIAAPLLLGFWVFVVYVLFP